MKYLSIIKKQGIITLDALGHLPFLKTSGLSRACLTFSQGKQSATSQRIFLSPIGHKTKEGLPHTLFKDAQLAKQYSQFIPPEKAKFQTQS